jgi:hypothetical protein
VNDGTIWAAGKVRTTARAGVRAVFIYTKLGQTQEEALRDKIGPSGPPAREKGVTIDNCPASCRMKGRCGLN